MQPLNHLVNNLVKKVLNKQHPFLAEINSHWDQLIGLEFCQLTLPFKILSYKKQEQNFNILYIQVSSPAVSLNLYFHHAAILERITIYLGFKAIHQIKMVINSRHPA